MIIIVLPKRQRWLLHTVFSLATWKFHQYTKEACFLKRAVRCIVVVLQAYLAISSQAEMSKMMGEGGQKESRESGPGVLEPLRLSCYQEVLRRPVAKKNMA